MQVVKAIAHFETILVDAIDKDSVSMDLDSVSTPAGNLPSGLYGFVIDQESNSKREYVIGTLSGSTLTFTIRDVSPLDANTADSSSDDDRKSHRKGASVKLSNFPVLTQLARLLQGDASIDESNPIYYAGEPTLTQREELATVGYVLDTTNGGEVSYSKTVVTGNAGATVAAGDVLYFDTTDQEWKLADADTAYSDDTQFGIAQGAGTDGNAISGGILIRGVDSNQSGLTAGATQYISTTAGDLTETAPSNDIFVGVAKSTTEVIVNFENRITDYLNSDDVTQGTTLQEQTTSSGTIEVGEADATTKKNSIAQKFTATKTKMRGFKLWKKADTGTFTGSIVITLQADNSGEPSGTPLATLTITNNVWNSLTDDQEYTFYFDSEYTSLVVGDDYWIDIQPSTSDNTNHPNFGGRTTGGTGDLYYNNTTDGWVQLANHDLYYKILEGNTNQIVKTGADGVIASALRPAVFKIGLTTQNLASTTKKEIAHGLGAEPALVRLTIVYANTNTAANPDTSEIDYTYVVFDGTSHASVAIRTGDGGAESYSTKYASSSNFRIYGELGYSSSPGYLQGTITVDATNIYITWSTADSPSGTVDIVWEVYA